MSEKDEATVVLKLTDTRLVYLLFCWYVLFCSKSSSPYIKFEIFDISYVLNWKKFKMYSNRNNREKKSRLMTFSVGFFKTLMTFTTYRLLSGHTIKATISKIIINTTYFTRKNYIWVKCFVKIHVTRT